MQVLNLYETYSYILISKSHNYIVTKIMKSKQYEEMDDSKALEIWKSKSLNSKPTETYKISNKPIAASPE